jgi:hypothetical protein
VICTAAHTCLKLARHEESLASSEWALALNPWAMPAWTFKVEVLLCLRRYKEALAVRWGDAQIAYCRAFARSLLKSSKRR